jgi:hypothetical protein
MCWIIAGESVIRDRRNEWATSIFLSYELTSGVFFAIQPKNGTAYCNAGIYVSPGHREKVKAAQRAARR